jgi:methionyl-tRNA formyltransferase
VLHGARPGKGPKLESGELLSHGDSLYVGAGQDSALELLEVQIEGKKRMSARDFANGYRPTAGERFGS